MIYIQDTDFIGNSLTAININYNDLNISTNNILFSSYRYFEPLVNFYNFYGDFWKNTINYAYSINAKNRLLSFYTNVLTNSANWINPIVLIYPEIKEKNNINFSNLISELTLWINSEYNVLNDSIYSTNFVENTKAYIYVMLYEENLKINSDVYLEDPANCQTNNVSVTITCKQNYTGQVSCNGQPNVCGAISGTICSNTKTGTCDYENNEKQITRKAIGNLNFYQKDRSENESLFLVQMKVDDCKWIYEKTII
jgi:hypothetical protein